MKLTHKLCGAVLLAAVGVAVAVPGITKADAEADKQFAGDMDIQFTANSDDNTDTSRPDLTDSDGNSDSDIISGTITRPLRPVIFGIQDVTPLSFGKQAIVTDGNDRVFWAKNYEEPNGVMANNVAIKDVRSTLDHSYTLTAEITTPLTTMVKDGANEVKQDLTGATLLYKNIGVKTNVAKEIALSGDSVKGEAKVTQGAATVFVDNKKAKPEDTMNEKGQGQSYIHFGKLNATGEFASTQSVQLTIGKEKSIFQGDYKGVVTWVMAETK
ncbi:WxL domain-containing protein [Enterococcus sp. AZ177]|uniref:WxL domain-containing protein n=1 Tax=unclassified Enterococcus TaxID=2608891 RepID=UPI003D2FC17E